MTISKIAGRVRGLFAGNYPENREDEQFHLNNRGDAIVALGLPLLAEVVRMGRSYHVMNVTAVASVTAVPTTAITLALWNGEPDGGRSYIIDSVHALFTVNSAALPHVGIIGMLNLSRQAAPTDAALTMRRLSGKTKGDTLARNTVGGTALAANDGWFPIGNSINAAVTSLPGFQLDVRVDGLYIVPPGGMFAIHTLGSVTSSSAICGIRWHEAQLILG